MMLYRYAADGREEPIFLGRICPNVYCVIHDFKF